ncbi:DUF1830 domain-containing protein [Cyanobium sp. PCC 7001]|uniref:DUF1830 domain-containing protein n=1 Tax=Cyanobium sp. PCC 7001 TaxID=180281 RepID=UPI001CECB346|nr:DUF1830 domain-containing protein [Cyanobium sp. PCC 7001]
MVITLTWLECGYRNSSDRMVIARCVGPEQFFLERVVFPFELLSFSCPPASELKIWTHGLGGPELIETLAVADLEIEAGADEPPPPERAAAESPKSGGAGSQRPRGLSFSKGNGDLVEAWVSAV